MILQKINLHYILFIGAIIFSCNSNVERSTKKETKQVVNQQNKVATISQNSKKELKNDTVFYNNIRPNQPLYLDKIYKDTLEVARENNDSDYFSYALRKGDSLYNFTYYLSPEEEEYGFARGDIVEVMWNIDTLYIAGEDDSIAYDLWIVNSKILSKKSFEVSDTLSVLKYVLGKEFLNYYILDWSSGDINKDKKEDFIVVLESDFEDKEITGDEETRIRKAVILETIDFPKMKISAYNDEVVDCSMCSGSGNRDPYRKTVIKNNYFSFESKYGGWQSDYFVITFKYEVQKENWFLHKVGVVSQYGEKENEIFQERTKKDFGEITFENYTDIKDK